MKAVIVGCGRVGGLLAASLDAAGHDVIIIDLLTKAFDRLPATFGGEAFRGDGTDEDALRRAGADGADFFLALTEGDNRNIMAAQLAREALGIGDGLREGQRPDARRGVRGARHRDRLPYHDDGRRAARRDAAPGGERAVGSAGVRARPRAARRRSVGRARGGLRMFVLVVGGGKVGYYLTRELSESGHEVVLMEKDRGRADQIADEIGSIVVAKDGCEGSALADAGANRADVVAAVTGDDEDNLVICQMAKHHFAVPKTIARVNNPKNEPLFKHLGVDELISPTRMILGSIEQDIPVHELLHLAPALPRVRARRGAADVGVARRRANAAASSSCPAGCAVVAIVRDEVAQAVGPETIFRAGDKVIAAGRNECEPALHVAADRRASGRVAPDPPNAALASPARPVGAGTARSRAGADAVARRDPWRAFDQA